MNHSTEYIEGIYRACKSHLPDWLWKQLHKIAFPSSGGRARWRKAEAPINSRGNNVAELLSMIAVRGEPFSKVESAYKLPTEKPAEACGACRFYLRNPDVNNPSGFCQIVTGDILWFATCALFVGAEEEAVNSLQAAKEGMRPDMGYGSAYGNGIEKQGVEVQTLVFPKDKWTLARARRWASDHDFNTDKLDETENSYRFRQQQPGRFERIRPFCLTPVGAAPNLEDCTILAFGGPVAKTGVKTLTQKEIDSEIDKVIYGGSGKKKRKPRVIKEDGSELTDIEIDIELGKQVDPYDISKQEDAPARALPLVTDAPITNDRWESSAEVAAMDVARLRRSTLAFVGGNPESKANYKLPYRDRRGRINANAVRAVRAALGGARGGVDLPQSIRGRVTRNSQRLIDLVREEAQKADTGTGKGVTKEVPILKIDQEKRIVYGVVLDPYILDTQGDWAPPAEVEKTAHDWLISSRTVGLGHKVEANAVPVESFLMPYPSTEDYNQAMANEPHKVYKFRFGDGFVHSGSWVLGTKVNDEGIWQLVKSGELNAYSIGGTGERHSMDTAQVPKPTEVIEIDWSKAA